MVIPCYAYHPTGFPCDPGDRLSTGAFSKHDITWLWMDLGDGSRGRNCHPTWDGIDLDSRHNWTHDHPIPSHTIPIENPSRSQFLISWGATVPIQAHPSQPTWLLPGWWWTLPESKCKWRRSSTAPPQSVESSWEPHGTVVGASPERNNGGSLETGDPWRTNRYVYWEHFFFGGGTLKYLK